MSAAEGDRPACVVLVVATGTGVGKTWVAAHVATRLLADGRRVAVRKPAQSFEPGAGPTDAEVLAAASGERPQDVCPAHRWYEVPMAPFMAAEVLGRPPFALADLVAELSWPEHVQFGLVEAAGGVRSPITSDGGDSLDLANALVPDAVLLVADAGLGAINNVLLSVDALAAHELIVMLNRYDETIDVHRRNHSWLTGRLEPPVVTDADDVAAWLTERPAYSVKPVRSIATRSQ